MIKSLIILILLFLQFGLNAQTVKIVVDSTFQTFFDLNEPINGGYISDIWEDKTNGDIYIIGDFLYNYQGHLYTNALSFHRNGDLNSAFKASNSTPSTRITSINDSTIVAFDFLYFMKLNFNGELIEKDWYNMYWKTAQCSWMLYPYFYKDGSILTSKTKGNPNVKNACAIVNPPDTFPHQYIIKVDPNGYWDSTLSINTNKDPRGFIPYDSNRILVFDFPRHTVNYEGHSVNGIWRIYLDGTIDTTFNSPFSNLWTTGTVFPNLVQEDGKILATGYFLLDSSNKYHTLVRLNSDGSLDSTFMNHSGPIDSNYTHASSVTTICRSTDGGYIVAGNFNKYQGYRKNRIAKIDSNGVVQPGYFTGEGPDSSYLARIEIEPFITKVIPSAFGGYYVVGNFMEWDGKPSQPIIKLTEKIVGIEEYNSKTFIIKIYPNPTKEIINIAYVENFFPDRIEIYNSQGIIQKVLFTGFERIEIDDLASGFYFMKVFNKNHFDTINFIKI